MKVGGSRAPVVTTFSIGSSCSRSTYGRPARKMTGSSRILYAHVLSDTSRAIGEKAHLVHTISRSPFGPADMRCNAVLAPATVGIPKPYTTCSPSVPKTVLPDLNGVDPDRLLVSTAGVSGLVSLLAAESTRLAARKLGLPSIRSGSESFCRPRKVSFLSSAPGPRIRPVRLTTMSREADASACSLASTLSSGSRAERPPA